MGVKGLLPCLRDITRPVSLEKYRGLTAAVDAMSWLHKGIFTCDVRALAIAQFEYINAKDNLDNDNGPRGMNEVKKRIDFENYSIDTNKDIVFLNDMSGSKEKSRCVSYVIQKAQCLKVKYGIESVLVIDGAPLPSKGNTDKSRRRNRNNTYQKALVAEKEGKARVARKLFAAACSITYDIRKELIYECRREKISFIVAPYEADAQMARLSHTGAVDLVITEDSDLLVYGCPRVVFKIDFKTGKGDEIQLMRDLVTNDSPSFHNWNHEMFVYMCILAGCDYCEGISGIGIQTAHKLVRIHRKPSSIFTALKNASKFPDGFDNMFWTAYRTFRHQRIYCQEKLEIDFLFPILELSVEREISDASTGSWIEPAIAKGIAIGDLHPCTKNPWKEVLKEQNHIDQKSTRNGNRSRTYYTHSSAADENISNMFAFFKPNDNLLETSIKGQSRDICVNKPTQTANLVYQNVGKNRNRGLFPLHSQDYSSNFVACTFKTLSRSRKSNIFSKRQDILKNIKDIESCKVTSPRKRYKQKNACKKETYPEFSISSNNFPSSFIDPSFDEVHHQASLNLEIDNSNVELNIKDQNDFQGTDNVNNNIQDTLVNNSYSQSFYKNNQDAMFLFQEDNTNKLFQDTDSLMKNRDNSTFNTQYNVVQSKDYILYNNDTYNKHKILAPVTCYDFGGNYPAEEGGLLLKEQSGIGSSCIINSPRKNIEKNDNLLSAIEKFQFL